MILISGKQFLISHLEHLTQYSYRSLHHFALLQTFCASCCNKDHFPTGRYKDSLACSSLMACITQQSSWVLLFLLLSHPCPLALSDGHVHCNRLLESSHSTNSLCSKLGGSCFPCLPSVMGTCVQMPNQNQESSCSGCTLFLCVPVFIECVCHLQRRTCVTTAGCRSTGGTRYLQN